MKTKITAEEKHYEKLNKRLHRDIAVEHKHYRAERQMNIDLELKYSELKLQNEQLVLINEKLQSMVGLTNEEVKSMLRSAININRSFDICHEVFRSY